jgi:hypothetical protein
VYLIRDGRDVAISYYHYLRRRGLNYSDPNRFALELLRGGVRPYGPWQDHAIDWMQYAQTHEGRVLFVRYEDLKAFPTSVISQIAAHLQITVSNDALAFAIAESTPQAMRSKEERSPALAAASKTGAPFVRSATTESWRSELSPDISREFASVAGEVFSAFGYAAS